MPPQLEKTALLTILHKKARLQEKTFLQVSFFIFKEQEKHECE